MSPPARKRRERHAAERRWYRHVRERAATHKETLSASYLYAETFATTTYAAILPEGVALSWGGRVGSIVTVRP